MLGYLPYHERLGTQRDSHPYASRPFKAYTSSPMSLPSTGSLYQTPPTSGLPAYSSMDYHHRPPPGYDVTGSMMDLSEAGPGQNTNVVKVEDYYMPPHYSYAQTQQTQQTQAPSKSSPPIPHHMGGGGGPLDTGSMGHPSSMPIPDQKLIDISPTNSDHSQRNGGSSGSESSGSKMPPKKRALAVPESQKDEHYWDKRKKNNESAKRSREQRRMKEEQIAMRVVYLEQENLQLRTEVSLLKTEIEKLRCMLYNS